jgi:hypothetical protein
MITDHIDRQSIYSAILAGSYVPGHSVHPDQDWGNTIATAHNQNLATRWLHPPAVSAAPSS